MRFTGPCVNRNESCRTCCGRTRMFRWASNNYSGPRFAIWKGFAMGRIFSRIDVTTGTYRPLRRKHRHRRRPRVAPRVAPPVRMRPSALELDSGKPNRLDKMRVSSRPVECWCGRCHACAVREIRHRHAGGMPHCPFCAERELKQREWARALDRWEYTRFPVAMPTMFGLITGCAERGVIRRRGRLPVD